MSLSGEMDPRVYGAEGLREADDFFSGAPNHVRAPCLCRLGMCGAASKAGARTEVCAA